MDVLTLLSGYGFMIVIMLTGMLSKGRKAKYHFRMVGCWYMIFFSIAHLIFEDELWIKIYEGFLAILWLWLADQDFRRTQFLDREYARLNKLKAENKVRIAELFYDRRN